MRPIKNACEHRLPVRMIIVFKNIYCLVFQYVNLLVFKIIIKQKTKKKMVIPQKIVESLTCIF